jgi:hypothetical protein
LEWSFHETPIFFLIIYPCVLQISSLYILIYCEKCSLVIHIS